MQFEHNGHTVAVSNAFRFSVTGPQFNGEEFSSANDAKNEIDERIATAQREAIATGRIALAALDADTGNEITIRGVNRADGSVLGSTKSRNGNGNLFPAVSWIKTLLIERISLRKRVSEINKELSPYELSGRRTYGHVGLAAYDGLVSDLTTEFDQKAQAALAATPKPDAT